MAKTSNRRVNIFLNGKAVEGSIKDIRKEWRKLNNEIGNTQIGTDEYRKKAKRISELKSVMDKHRNNLKSIDGAYKKVSGGLSKYLGIAAAGFGIREIVSYGRRVLDLGIQMDTLGRKAQTVFGEVLPLVTRQAEENAQAMGLTTSQYVDAAAAMQDLLVPMGFQREEAANISTELVNLSGALSEWTGGQRSSTEVAEILQKALLGEREQLKSLGISILEADVKARLAEKGLKGLTGEMLQQAKAAATLELIMEKTTDAQAAFAEGGDSAIRTQTELSAKFTEIKEKIATALLPVFAKLLNELNKIVDVGISIADAFVGFIDPVKGATQAFDEQAKKVSDLEAELPDLLKRYEELSSKSSKTEEEQAELSKVIQRIGEVTPTAITEIDKYGNVLSINATASKEFLEAEKARLNFVNKESIQTIKQQIKDLESLAKLDKERIESGRQGLANIKLSAERINELRVNYGKLAKEIDGARAELARLQGESPIKSDKEKIKTKDDPDINYEKLKQAELLNILKTGNENQRLLAAAEIARREKLAEELKKKREKEAERELKDLEKQKQRLLEVIKKFQEEELLSTLSEGEQKIKQLELRYQKEIDKAKELEAKGVEGATEARLELERIAQQQISALRQQLQNEAFDKELEEDLAKRKENDKKLKEYEDQKAAAEKTIQDEIRQTYFDEQTIELLQLEEHYAQLIALANKHGIDTLSLELALEKKRKELKDKFRNEDVKRDEAALKARVELQSAQIGLFKGFANALGQIAGNNSKVANAIFLFEKGLAAADLIVKLQLQLAAIRTKYALIPGGVALAAAESVKARVDTAAGLTAIAGATIGRFVQKKKGGWLNARGQDDNVNYRAQYIGSPNTGMLPSHPVVLASEAGPEYFVSNKALENPYVLNHVRAIENITSMRQFRDGGATEALPTSSPPTPSPTSEAQNAFIGELKTSIDQLSVILANGIFARYDDDEIIKFNKKFNELNSASGGTILQ